MIAVTETGSTFWDKFQAVVTPSLTPSVGAVHHGGTNVLFCDGHVQWYRLEDITYPYRGGETVQSPHDIRVVTMWNAGHHVR
jgi:prepilin-type processing-associated H-X9-DG protein